MIMPNDCVCCAFELEFSMIRSVALQKCYTYYAQEETKPEPTVMSVDRLRINLILSAKPFSAITRLAQLAIGWNA